MVAKHAHPHRSIGAVALHRFDDGPMRVMMPAIAVVHARAVTIPARIIGMAAVMIPMAVARSDISRAIDTADGIAPRRCSSVLVNRPALRAVVVVVRIG